MATALLLLTSCSGPEPGECGAPVSLVVTQGQILESSILRSSFFDDDHHEVRLQTADEVVEFEVFGDGDLLEVGETYDVGLAEWGDEDTSRLVGFLHSDEPCMEQSTIRVVGQDGQLIDIEEPPRFTSPISVQTFVLGALAFTAAIAVFGRIGGES